MALPINIEISRKGNADVMSCLSLCIDIAKTIDNTVYLNMGSYSIPVNKNSYYLDLLNIYMLEEKLISDKLKEK